MAIWITGSRCFSPRAAVANEQNYCAPISASWWYRHALSPALYSAVERNCCICHRYGNRLKFPSMISVDLLISQLVTYTVLYTKWPCASPEVSYEFSHSRLTLTIIQYTFRLTVSYNYNIHKLIVYVLHEHTGEENSHWSNTARFVQPADNDLLAGDLPYTASVMGR